MDFQGIQFRKRIGFSSFCDSKLETGIKSGGYSREESVPPGENGDSMGLSLGPWALTAVAAQSCAQHCTQHPRKLGATSSCCSLSSLKAHRSWQPWMGSVFWHYESMSQAWNGESRGPRRSNEGHPGKNEKYMEVSGSMARALVGNMSPSVQQRCGCLKSVRGQMQRRK